MASDSRCLSLSHKIYLNFAKEIEGKGINLCKVDEEREIERESFARRAKEPTKRKKNLLLSLVKCKMFSSKRKTAGIATVPGVENAKTL